MCVYSITLPSIPQASHRFLKSYIRNSKCWPSSVYRFNVFYGARRMRKALGGGMRQVGVLAAPGLVALDKMINRLEEDHKRTYRIGEAIFNLNSKYFKVDLPSLDTNILMIYLDTDKFVAKDVLQRFANVRKDDKYHTSVRAISRNPKFIRITLYHNINDADVEMAIDKICLVFREFETNY